MTTLQVSGALPRLSRRDWLRSYGPALPPAVAVLSGCRPARPAQTPAAGSPQSDLGLKPGEVITLQIAWEQTANEMGQFVTGQAKDLFEQRFPQIRLEFIPQGNTVEKLTAAFAAGVPPDVIHTPVAQYPRFAAAGMLQPIDPFVARDRSFDKDDFEPVMWNAFVLDGKTWAIPREGGPTVLYYNKHLFDAAGVPYPTDDWTWDDWRMAALKLTKRSGDEIVQFGMHAPSWEVWVWGAGGDILNPEMTRCVMDSPQAIAGLQEMQDVIWRWRVAPSPAELSSTAPINLFIAGQLATFPGLRSAGNTAGFVQPHVALSLLPKGPAGRAYGFPGNGIGIAAPTKYPLAAWEVAKFYTSTEFQKLHYKLGIGGVVARNSTLRSPEYLNSAFPREWNEYFAKGRSAMRRFPPTPLWDDISRIINAEVAKIRNNQEAPRVVAKSIVEQVNALLQAKRG
jgi:ABC-type glycerol-3-phosphate transport system substrate-binding protein